MSTQRMRIRVSGSDVGPAESDAVASVMQRGYLGMGQEVAEFERLLGEFIGRPSVCVATGTAALQLALQACGVHEGDEVLVPSLTYVAAFQAIRATGARPVAVDVFEDSLTLDPDSAKQRLSSRAKAVMPVHYGGSLPNPSLVYDFARQHGLRVIEDAAHAFGSVGPEGRVGLSGDVVCFSFDPIKNITSGDGGCVTSADESVLARVRDARLLGVQGDSAARTQERRLYEFDVVEPGWRYHMNNISAAIGITQLRRFGEMATKRRALARQYDEIFATDPRVKVLPHSYENVVPHIYVIRFSEQSVRDVVRSRLMSEFGIETGIHWYPNHLLTRFRSSYSLPVTEKAYQTMVTLPLHPRLTLNDVALVAHSVLGILDDTRINAVGDRSTRHTSVFPGSSPRDVQQTASQGP